MAGALYMLLQGQMLIAVQGRTTNNSELMKQRHQQVKGMEAEYIADQQARAAAALSNNALSGASAAAAASPSAASAAAAPPATASAGPVAVAAATYAASNPLSAGSLLPRGAGGDRDERKDGDAHLSPASALIPPVAANALAVASAQRPSQASPVSAPAAAAAAASPTASASAVAVSVASAVNAASLAAAMLRQHESSFALIRYAEQMERDKEQVEQEKTRLSTLNGQLSQDKAQLQRQLNERTAELAIAQRQAAAAASQAERLIAVKQEKFDAVADAHGAAQQAAKATADKRKAETELKSEAKRRRDVEGKLTALTDQMDEKDKCIICLETQPDVLFLRCRHLVCCSGCAASIVHGGAAGATCPQCQTALVAKDVVKVFRA
jgi:hypothetical protein